MITTLTETRPAVEPVQVVLSPTKANAYQRCGLAYQADASTKRRWEPSPAQERGNYVHELLRLSHALAAKGQMPGMDELLARLPPPRAWRDGGEREAKILNIARSALHGFRSFLREEAFLPVLAAEQYIRTAPRPVRGVEHATIVFSGRLDVVARRADGRLAVVDIKTGALTPADVLLESAGAFVYATLLGYAHGVQPGDVEIVHVAPVAYDWHCVRLGPEQCTNGVELCRAMVRDVVSGIFAPRSGAHCTWCAHTAACSLVRQPPRLPQWAQPF